MALSRITLVLLAVALAPRAEAITLYKSIGPNGVVEFSDTPPDGTARLIEQRDLAAPQRPAIETAPAPAASMESLITEDAVARATAQVDLAEHALALARRGVWAPMEGLRLKGPRRTAADEQRIEYYKHNVLLARQALLEVLKERLTTVASR
jgi:Domain of unknown function (DUF4124)